MISKIKDDLHSSKNSAVFDKTAKKYQEIAHKFANSLYNFIRQLLKSKDPGIKEDTLRWIAASITSN